MKIHEVMKETGLTKKAIYYYEDAGLIRPAKEAESNYRLYTAEDVEKLVTIQALRKLDFSIKDIQLALSVKENFASALEKQLGFLSDEIERLSRNRQVLEGFLTQGLSLKTDDLKLLIQQLDEGSRSITGYMQKELDRILPGNLGKVFAIHYGQFLDEPLDTKEKETAWLELIAFLDSVEEIEYPEGISEIVDEMFGKYNDRELSELSEKAKNVTASILGRTTEVSDSEKASVSRMIEDYEKTPEYQNFLVFQKFTADHLAPIFKEVDQYVSVLSNSFEKYSTILRSAAKCT